MSHEKSIHKFLDTTLRPSRNVSGYHNAKEWLESGGWANVRSDNVAAVRYDMDKREMEVVYIKTRAVYTYFGIDIKRAVDLFYANSVGRYVYFYIKRKGYRKHI